MKNLINFRYDNQELRTVIKDDVLWFVVKDVCSILDLNDPSKAVLRLEEDEKGTNTIPTLGGNQNLITVNEFGLYNLIFTSRKAEAKAFKRWVTHEVLPAIRKDGVYVKEKPGMSLEYQGKTIMIESLMNERLALLEMNREIIRQFRLVEQRVFELEEGGLIRTAKPSGKPTVHIRSTNADECTSLFVEFIFSGKHKSFDAMNCFLQALENFLVGNGYHQNKECI